jgi:hypothetical protein
MHRATLSLEEKDWLMRLVDVEPPACRQISPNSFECTMTEDLADDLRDRCADELLRSGFEADYNRLNDRGRILQSLVDKLFVG